MNHRASQRDLNTKLERERACRDKVDELIHRSPNFVVEGLQQLRYLILTEGLQTNEKTGQCHYRNYVWTILLQADLSNPDLYISLVKQGNSVVDAKIQNDTFRTLATDASFKSKVSEQALSRILNAFVHANDHMSYVQGMNVIAAPFLFVSKSESQAFALFNKFLTKCCPLYVTPTLIGVHTALDLVDVLLVLADPVLANHLRSKMLTANLYAFASIMTFSAGTPPLAEVIKLWDVLLAYGAHLNVLFVVAQVLILRDRLLSTEKPMTLLRSFPPLEARKISTAALALLHKVPPDLYELIVRHGSDSAVQFEVDAYRRKHQQ